jgi:hypothetical protein
MAKGNQRIEPLFEGDREAARMGELARKLDQEYPAPTTSPRDYAPPEQLEETVVRQAHSFLELPIKEVEEVRAAAKAEVEALDKEADEVIKEFQTRIARVKAGYERLRKGTGLSMDAFKVLREQCLKLDEEIQQ